MQINIVNLGEIQYEDALALQYRLAELRRRDRMGATLLLLEHPHVLTLGTRGQEENIYADAEELAKLGIGVVRTNRGGDVTYHGPGQLVGYPIFHASDFERDIAAFVAHITSALIRLLKERWNIDAHAERGKYTGVWAGEEKIAAVGIAVSASVTMHGFAFNINTDLSYFDLINPCGLSRGVTSLQKLTGQAQDKAEARELTGRYFAAEYGCDPRIIELETLLAEAGEDA
jgi:lipoyl(octanoyl) transferase